MKVIGQTHIGLVRENNQDALVYGTLSETAHYAVVCDGMGGANGGNIASKIAVEVIGSRIRDGYSEQRGVNSIERLLSSAVASANISVIERALQQPELHGMGTTAVAVIVCEHTAHISHVGDSRLYLFRDGELTLVTRDHSVVQNMIESGEITAEEAHTHPRRNYITRALGVVEEECGEYDELELMAGDRLLLCTDGLTNELTADMMADTLRLSIDEALESLIRSALDGGGADNITAVLMDID